MSYRLSAPCAVTTTLDSCDLPPLHPVPSLSPSQSDVIKRNTGLSNLQTDVFVFRSPAVQVSVYNDRNKDGQQQQTTEPFLSGATVTITNPEGATVGTGLTNTGGSVRASDCLYRSLQSCDCTSLALL